MEVQKQTSPIANFFQKKNKKYIIIAVCAIFLVLIGVISSAIVRRNNNLSASAAKPASFGDCLKDNTKPGQDPSVANDICLRILGSDANRADDPSRLVTQIPMNNTQQNTSHDDPSMYVTQIPQPSATMMAPDPGGHGLGDPNSTDPEQKGKALSNGQCEGKGSVPLTHAIMDLKDIRTIQPMGAMIGGHVTPIDHEYYYPNAGPKDAYPVYADADGIISEVQFVNDGVKDAWRITIAHSCTFLSIYNLLTSFTPALKSKLPAGWGPNNNGNVKIPVKAGDIIGKVGNQSLDYQLADTETQLKGFLYPIAYNNREPWKINTVEPLKYFSEDVKKIVLQRYMRTAEPRDGRIDYDVDGQAVGTWFVKGSNGYAGGTTGNGTTAEYATHLALAYDSFDITKLMFSIGDYKGNPTQFAVKGSTDWTKITPSSGLVKVELAQPNYTKMDGSKWGGEYTAGLKLIPGPTQATALLQMTSNQEMKVEVFAGKTPAQVSAFTANAKTYNRGQDAKMLVSNTAH